MLGNHSPVTEYTGLDFEILALLILFIFLQRGLQQTSERNVAILTLPVLWAPLTMISVELT